MNLRDALQAIYDKRGELTPENVVEESKDEQHPLHDRFDWDDAVAGPKWRRHQAHEMIQTVEIAYRVAEDGREEKIRAFHAVRKPDNSYAYHPAEVIAEDPMLRTLLLRDMERDWQAMQSRYSHMAEFVEMVKKDVA